RLPARLRRTRSSPVTVRTLAPDGSATSRSWATRRSARRSRFWSGLSSSPRRGGTTQGPAHRRAGRAVSQGLRGARAGAVHGELHLDRGGRAWRCHDRRGSVTLTTFPGGGTHRGARVMVAAGQHKITCADGCGITVYGYSDGVSYMFAGGLDLKPIVIL